jgi:hypothetical protein
MNPNVVMNDRLAKAAPALYKALARLMNAKGSLVADPATGDLTDADLALLVECEDALAAARPPEFRFEVGEWVYFSARINDEGAECNIYGKIIDRTRVITDRKEFFEYQIEAKILVNENQIRRCNE